MRDLFGNEILNSTPSDLDPGQHHDGPRLGSPSRSRPRARAGAPSAPTPGPHPGAPSGSQRRRKPPGSSQVHPGAATAATEAPGAIPVIPAITSTDLASFHALRASIHLEHQVWGSVWLVPEYTGASRPEISATDLAKLINIQAVFPGSKIRRFIAS